jgi:hypothetical protein
MAKIKDPNVARILSICSWVLLVIMVFVFLRAMFFTGPSVVKERPRRMYCESNLKQIGIAISLYADLYQGRCPIDSARPTLVGSMQLLSNVCQAAKILYCPDDSRRDVRPEMDFRKLTSRNISYSYVPNQVWAVNSTSRVIIALDRVHSTSAGKNVWPKDGNHDGKGGHVLFNTGAVAFFTNLPFSLKDKDGKEIVLSP